VAEIHSFNSRVWWQKRERERERVLGSRNKTVSLLYYGSPLKLCVELCVTSAAGDSHSDQTTHGAKLGLKIQKILGPASGGVERIQSRNENWACLRKA
jgi:hypothetical protein